MTWFDYFIAEANDLKKISPHPKTSRYILERKTDIPSRDEDISEKQATRETQLLYI